MLKKKYNKEEKSFFKEMFWYSFQLENCYNYERQQGLGFAIGMWPVIKRTYRSKEDRTEALKRHMQIFNTNPHLVTMITGVVSAMEKENSQNPDFDESSINSVKVSLMGPLAGVGDSLFWGTLRVLATAIAIPLCQEGNILGPILFLLIFNIPHLLIRYYGGVLGYTFGTDLLTNIEESSVFQKVSKAATIVGLMVVGAMSANMVDITTPLTLTFGETSFLLQDFIDQIFPKLLPLLYTFFMYWLMTKQKKSSTYVLSVTIAIGIGGALLGIF